MSGIPLEDPQEVEAVKQSWQVQSMSEPGRQADLDPLEETSTMAQSKVHS